MAPAVRVRRGACPNALFLVVKIKHFVPEWRECANTGHSRTARRTGQIDSSLPFPMNRDTGEISPKGRRRYGQMRKAASIRDHSDRIDVGSMCMG